MHFILSLYKQAFSKLDRHVWILALAMFVNRSGSVVLLFTSLYLTNELHFTIGEAGLAMSFYGAGSILGSFTGGWLTDRKNYFDVMVSSLFLSGIILPFILLAENLVTVSIVIFLYSFAADMFRPAMSKGIAYYSTAENRTRSVSLIRLAINLGFSVGPAIGGFVAFYFGYRPLMLMDAATSFLAGIVVLYAIPRKPVITIHEEKKLISDTKSAYRDFHYLFFILMVAIYGVCFFQIFASIPMYLDKEFEYSEKTIGWVLALNGILVVIIEMPLMVLLQKEKRIFRFILVGAMCVPSSLFILLSGNGGIIWVIFYTFVITFSEIFTMPFMMNFSLSRPAKERQGEYAALYSIAFGLANIGAPLIGLGIAHRYDFHTLFYVLMGLGVLNVLGFWYLKIKLEPDTTNEKTIDATKIS